MEGWALVYDAYEPAQQKLREALCTLGNGYFATRGAAPDADAGGNHYPGTYLAGGYNRLTSEIAGRRIENEDLVNWPNWLPMRLRIGDGDWIHIDGVELLDYRQALHLDRGVLERTLRLRDPCGRITRWREERFVSMDDPHCAALRVQITAENWSGPVTLRSALDGSVRNAGVARYASLASRHLEPVAAQTPDEETVLLQVRASQSRVEMAQAARTRVFRGTTRVDARRGTRQGEDWIGQDLALALHENETIAVEKVVAVHTSRDRGIAEAGIAATRALSAAAGFDELLAAHETAWEQLWEDFELEIDTGERDHTVLKLRLHIFHLLQTVSHHSVDMDAGVPARGWTGEAYRGHIFWDEVFILPLLNLRMPMLTRALLRYRHRRLPEARRAAAAAGFAGAMFPWQSGSDGREESQQVHLNPASGRWIADNSHRQRHISVAIAYCIWQYFQASGDREFLTFAGAEMLLEIARFWASLAQYDERHDRYEIRGVMGPDEYHTAYPDVDETEAGGLHNNTYTNVMVAWLLARTEDVLRLLSRHQRLKICRRLALDQAEIERWDQISRKLRVVFHADGVLSQFEGYEALREFDWDDYRRRYDDIQRLDRILESEGDSPNRYKLSKQADVLMLFYLLSADELRLVFERLGYPLAPEIIPRTVQYYNDRTSHGSTLSRVVHSWVLARSDRSRSWELFCDALDSDLGDVQGGTTAEGVHLGAMAGTVDLLHRGYTGMEVRGDVLHFDPVLPDELRALKIAVRYRHHRLQVSITQDTLQVASVPVTAAAITISCRGDFRQLAPGQATAFRLIRPEELDRPDV